MKREVPFVPNEPDDQHCMQASYMMIAKYFEPDFAIPMDEWSKITAFDKSTWASAGLLWFQGQGYVVKHITLFDYQRFVEKGEDYLVALNGPEVAAWQIAHSNIQAEQERASKLLASGLIEQREPLQKDIKNYLESGYLVRIMINYCKLAGKARYIGHAVVIFDYDEQGVFMHDPGLPPKANRHVSWVDLEAAWADPNAESKELDAIKR